MQAICELAILDSQTVESWGEWKKGEEGGGVGTGEGLVIIRPLPRLIIRPLLLPRLSAWLPLFSPFFCTHPKPPIFS